VPKNRMRGYSQECLAGILRDGKLFYQQVQLLIVSLQPHILLIHLSSSVLRFLRLLMISLKKSSMAEMLFFLHVGFFHKGYRDLTYRMAFWPVRSL